MLKSNTLVLTTSSGTEIMLSVGENVVPVHMLHDIVNYDVFQHLTAKAGQRSMEIVGWFVSLTLLDWRLEQGLLCIPSITVLECLCLKLSVGCFSVRASSRLPL